MNETTFIQSQPHWHTIFTELYAQAACGSKRFIPRYLIQKVNQSVERRGELLTLGKGKAVKKKTRGTGKYKSFTSQSMLKVTFLDDTLQNAFSFCLTELAKSYLSRAA